MTNIQNIKQHLIYTVFPFDSQVPHGAFLPTKVEKILLLLAFLVSSLAKTLELRP